MSAGTAAAQPSLAHTLAQLSVIQVHGEHEDGHCGYCNGRNGSKTTYGITAERLSTLDYQAFCDQGWRRSGTYLYKPGTNICCPQNTIRLDVRNFVATKQQRRVVKRFNEFLRGERDLLNEKTDENEEDEEMRPDGSHVLYGSTSQAHGPLLVEPLVGELSTTLASCIHAVYGSSLSIKGPLFVPYRGPPSPTCPPVNHDGGASSSSTAVPLFFSAVALQVRAALARQAGIVKPRVKRQAGATGTSAETAAEVQQSPAPTSTDAPAGVPSPAEIAGRLVDAWNSLNRQTQSASSAPSGPGNHSNTSVSTAGVSLSVIQAQGHILLHSVPGSALHAAVVSSAPAGGSAAVHSSGKGGAGTAPATTTAARYPTHTFRVDMVPAAFDQASFKLWQKYQQAVHGEELKELDKGHYTRFLCTHPLLREPRGAPYAASLGQEHAGHGEAVQLSEQQASLAVRLAEACRCPVEQARGAVRHALQLQAQQQPAGPGAGAGTDGPDPNAVLKLLLQDMSAKAAGIAWGGSSSPAQCLARAAGSVRKGWLQGEGAGQGMPAVAPQPEAERLPPSVITGFGQQQAQEHGSSSDDAAMGAGRVQGSVVCPPFIFSDVLSPASAGTDLSQGYGAFHQRYYLDGRLIAVGVLDVLPLCLSSVYVFYDPDLGRTLQLGKLTALREIQWVQAVCRTVSPRLCWYYMGYYVRSCVKMRYKGEFSPSDVRCPVTGQWVPLAEAGPILDEEERQAAGKSGGGSRSSSSGRGKAARGGPLVGPEAQATWEGGQRLRDATRAAAVARVPLLLPKRGSESGPDLGPGVTDMCTVGDLTDKGKGIVKPVLLELLQRTGTELGTRLVVKL